MTKDYISFMWFFLLETETEIIGVYHCIFYFKDEFNI